ncbi:MAG TPA: TonB-dependent receptor, partial [Gemmatimonadales bacterium]|nr:TonB-dependent receptor [Gemmatimonadales bacterium]
HGHWQRPLGDAGGFDALLWGQGVRSRVFLNIPEDGVVAQTEEYDRRVALGGQARATRQIGAGELSGGVDGRADWSRYDLYDTEARVRDETEQSDDADFRSAGAFVRWRAIIGTRLVYDVGGRLDVLGYAARDLLQPSVPRQDRSRVIAGPKLGARLLLGPRVSLLASLSRGFRGAVGVIGDANRPPVTAWAKEIGASLDGARLQGKLALFRMDVADERIFDPVTREVSDAGESVRQGVTVDLSWTARPGLVLHAEGTFNDAKVTGVAETPAAAVPDLSTAALPVRPQLHDVPLTPGARVPGVARYFGRAGVEATLTPAVGARALVRVSGPFTPIGEPSVRTSAYGLVDLGGSVRLDHAGTTLDVDLLNALNTRYPELRASGFLNPGAPRTLRAAVRFGAPAR